MASLLYALRRAAPRPTTQAFQCTRLLRGATQADPLKELSLKYIRAFKCSTRRIAASDSFATETEIKPSSALSPLSKSLGQKSKKRKTSFFPKTSKKSVAYWLLGSAASVFGIVVFGGLTRLTESGYTALFQNGWQGANRSKPEYYRMEASYGQSAPNNRRGLGV